MFLLLFVWLSNSEMLDFRFLNTKLLINRGEDIYI